MQNPIQVTFRGMDPSEAVDRRIREKTACPRLSRDIYLLSSRTLVGPSDVDLWGEEA